MIWNENHLLTHCFWRPTKFGEKCAEKLWEELLFEVFVTFNLLWWSNSRQVKTMTYSECLYHSMHFQWVLWLYVSLLRCYGGLKPIIPLNLEKLVRGQLRIGITRLLHPWVDKYFWGFSIKHTYHSE